MKKLALFALAAALAFAPSASFAGSSTVSGKNAAGSTINWDVTTDGSGNNIPWLVICDSAAAAHCATVNASGQLLTLEANSAAILTALGSLGTAANQATIISSLATIATNTGAAIPAGTNLVGKFGIDQTTDGTTNGVRLTSQYPAGATAITASATGTTAATTATLAGTSGKTTYICSYSIRANATAATTVLDTVTGVITATMSSELWVAPAASGLGVDEQIFSPCVPASATNTGIAVVSGAPGTGGVVSVHATGYQQ